MPNCELCGREDNLNNAIVENARVKICTQCTKFGKIIQETINTKNVSSFRSTFEDSEEYVTDNYNSLIKHKREKLNLTQDELAIKLKEKVSLISSIERGDIKPTLELAKKFENSLGIRMITKISQEKQIPNEKSNSSLTIGDLLKKK